MATLTERLERRDIRRLPIPGSVRLRTGDRTVTADLVDVSTTGIRCFIREPVTLHQGDRVNVEVRAAGRSLTGEASVIWVQAQADGVTAGFNMEPLAPSQQAALEALLAEHGGQV
jgi:hypothetical protein